jgi:MFS superfamily sulfate permease-like transporter
MRAPTTSFPLADLMAGLTVASVVLPQAVAYAAIAGVPPVHAFVASLCGLLIYPLLGSSRLAIVTPTSSAAAIFASAAGVYGLDLGVALVLLTAALFLAAAALNIQFLGTFISRPVLRGFAWGLTVTIMVKQLPALMSVEVPAPYAIGEVVQLAAKLGQTHGHSLLLGAAALALCLGLQWAAPRWQLLPPAFVVLALGMAWAWGFDGAALGVALVGPINWQGALPHWPRLPMDEWLRAAQIAPALLLILFAESWGSVRSMALQSGDRVLMRRELAALGASNLASGVLQGLPVGAGLSAALANQAAGARSQRAGLLAAAVLALLLWLGRDAMAYLPQPVLAAVVVAILWRSLWPRALLESLKLGQDAWTALVAAASVLAFGVLFGMLVAVALSVLMALRRFSEPVVSEIARLPGTHDFLDRQHHADLEPTPPGLLLMRPEEPLFFANAETVLERVRQRVDQANARVLVLSMEMCDDLDSTAIEALNEVAHAFEHHGRALLFARIRDRPRRSLEAAMRRRAVQQQLGTFSFWSVEDAYEAALALLRAAPPRPEEGV